MTRSTLELVIRLQSPSVSDELYQRIQPRDLGRVGRIYTLYYIPRWTFDLQLDVRYH